MKQAMFVVLRKLLLVVVCITPLNFVAASDLVVKTDAELLSSSPKICDDILETSKNGVVSLELAQNIGLGKCSSDKKTCRAGTSWWCCDKDERCVLDEGGCE